MPNQRFNANARTRRVNRIVLGTLYAGNFKMRRTKDFFLHVTIIVLFVGFGITRSFADETATGRPDLRKVFGAQVALNTQACQLVSPYSNDNEKWGSRTFWSSARRQRIVVAFVLITSDLLNAALDYWQQDRPDLSTLEIKSYRQKLSNMFLKKGQKTFLMLVKPTFEGKYIEEWRVEIPDPKIGINLVSFDGRRGEVMRQEYLPKHLLYWDSDILSCLFWIEDVVEPENDPSYILEITNVFFHIEDDNPEGPRYHWLKSTVASSVHVRFETNEVNLMAMIEDNVPWSSIEEKYISPRHNQLTGVVGASLLGSIIDAGIGFLMRAIFKL